MTCFKADVGFAANFGVGFAAGGGAKRSISDGAAGLAAAGRKMNGFGI